MWRNHHMGRGFQIVMADYVGAGWASDCVIEILAFWAQRFKEYFLDHNFY